MTPHSSTSRALAPYIVTGLILAGVSIATPLRLLWFGAQPAWYESTYMPLTVALIAFVLLSLVAPAAPRAWLCGLLTTLPPYGVTFWQLQVFSGSEPDSDYRSLLGATLLLAFSGAVLNPLVVSAVKWARQRYGGKHEPTRR